MGLKINYNWNDEEITMNFIPNEKIQIVYPAMPIEESIYHNCIENHSPPNPNFFRLLAARKI